MLPFYLFISCLSWPSIGKNFASGIYNPHYLPYSFYCRRLISLLIRISQKIFPAIYGFGKFTCHGRFIESRNTSKSLYNIWQRSLLDERIAKICRQLNSHYGFLRTTQDSKKNAAGLAGLAALSCSTLKKLSWEIQCIAHFCNSLINKMKNVVKYWKDFFWNSSTP